VPQDVALQPDGRIVVAGFLQIGSAVDFALARYNSDGSLDSGFGVNGRTTTDFGGDWDSGHAVGLQTDGKIVVAGTKVTAPDLLTTAWEVARYNGGPSFDLCVQDDSNGNLLQINTTTGANQLTNCAGLSVGGTGTVTRRGELIMLQQESRDRHVLATIHTNTNKATASIHLQGQGPTFSINDRDITNNTCSCR